MVADLDALVAMGQRFLAQSNYRRHLTENPAQMRMTAAQLIEAASGNVFVAEADDGTLVGMLGVIVFPHHLSGDTTCGEVFWWVEPDRRGIGLRLLRAAEAWAKAQGATTLQLIAPSHEVETLYERLGFEAVERTYQKALA